MANTLTKESVGQLYLTAIVMSFLREGGLNALGQRTGDYVKFLLLQQGITDLTEFENRLHETLVDACEMFPQYIKIQEEHKRAKRQKSGTTA